MRREEGFTGEGINKTKGREAGKHEVCFGDMDVFSNGSPYEAGATYHDLHFMEEESEAQRG